MDRPNIFDFATSELSQDAFIAWLASWADPAHKSTADELLHATACQFLDRLIEVGGVSKPAAYQSVEVRQQFNDIDVLVLVNKAIAIIVEDKTDTVDHSDQLRRYGEAVKQEFPSHEIAAVYLKTGDQSNFRRVEQAGYGRFLRRDFLAVLDHGAKIQNDIFADFHRYLNGIEKGVQSYPVMPLDKWDADCWKGFFIALQERLAAGEWNYVPNPKGGFMGFWWHNKDNKYLQLEQHKLCFKIHEMDKSQQGKKWEEWHNALMAKNGAQGLRIRKSTRRMGKWMTVAVLEEDDFRQKGPDGRLDLDRTVDLLKRAEAFMDESLKLTVGPSPS